MERGPLLGLLHSMKNTDRQVALHLQGETQPVTVENVLDVEELHSSHGIKVKTRQNTIWIDASHVSMAYQSHQHGP